PEKRNTWLINMEQINAPATPDKTSLTAEARKIMEDQQSLTKEEIEKIRYWNAGCPSYRWNEIAMDLIAKNQKPVESNHFLSLLNCAVNDAMIITWKYKDVYKIGRPATFINAQNTVVDDPHSYSYPSEYSITSLIFADMLTHFFPADASFINEKLNEANTAILNSGMHFKSDMDAGNILGKVISAEYIAYAKKDGSDTKWDSIIPPGANKWNGKNPMYPTMGSWKTWTLTTGNQYRPAPPYENFESAEMEKIKTVKHTFDTDKTAFYWAPSMSRIMFEIVSKKIFEYKLDEDPVEAARIYALLYISLYDAQVAAWDAKYTYWGTRPQLYDPSFKPLIRTPNFPGYPSGHATGGASASVVMGYLFPADKNYFEALAKECAMSRFYAGIHFDIDNSTGLELGKKVGDEIVRIIEINNR
ncbi:MAG: phosphatase PAP2 family protein, partial [Chitinophagales bacterium]|nr:phosphatase PAP2 family protein [Chitinophagales bacterium]